MAEHAGMADPETYEGMSRPFRHPKKWVIEQLEHLRGVQGLKHWMIGVKLGYSEKRIQNLCYEFGIYAPKRPRINNRQLHPGSDSIIAGTSRPKES